MDDKDNTTSNAELVEGKYSIRDLVDIDHLRTVFEKFSQFSGYTTGFIAYPSMEILITTGWRDICTKFHRACPASACHCKASNVQLFGNLRESRQRSIRKCENGMHDGATPIIVRGKCLAFLTTGQALFEAPDIERFRKQARQYGFDEKEYLEALQKVPIVSEDQFRKAMDYLSEIAGILAEQGLKRLEIRESGEKFKAIFNSTYHFIGLMTTDGELLEANYPAIDFAGLALENAINRPFWETRWWAGNEDRVRKLKESILEAAEGKFIRYEVELQGAGDNTRIFDFSINPIFDRDGKVTLLVPEARDITDRRRMEYAIRLQAERVQVLLKLNQMTDATLQQITDYALEEGVRITQSEIGYLAFLNDDETVLTMHSWSRNAMSECDIINKPINYAVNETGLWGEAVRQRRPIITNDYAAPNPAKKGHPAGHVKMHRHMNVPVFVGKHIVLVAGMGNKDGEYDNVDVEQLTLLMEGMWRLVERKRAEEALRISELRYRELVDLAVDGILVGSHEGIITEANECMCNLTGRTREDLLGKHITCLFTPEVLKKTPLRFDLLQKGETVVGERKIVRPDSSAVVVEMRTKMMPDGSYQSIYRDITERKKAENDTRRARQFSDSVINSLPGMFYVIGSNGKLIRVNENFLKVSLYSMEEVLGMQVLDLFSGDEKEKVGSRIKEAFEKGESSVEAEFISKNGKRTAYYFSGYRANIDNTCLLVGLGIDITERKKAEEAREEMEERLRQSQKMEAIGQLAGGIAHDFNNQLMGIMGYAEILCTRLDEPSLRNDAESILRASRRASDLTRDLLAFSRKGKYLNVPVNVNKIIEEVISLLEHSIDKRIEIRRILNANPVMISGDPTQLQNSLLNLAINAKDALPSGGEILFTTDNVMMEDVFTTPEERSKAVKGRYMRICVIDDGIGMDDDTKKHLFEPFFTTKQPGKGTGMGLASVYGTVKSHNGVIFVDSRLGEGTVFSLYFPLIEDNTDLDRPETKTERTMGTSSILLVDDEEDVRTIISRILRSLGHTVVTCRDGQEAVEYYRQSWKSLDLVILDMMMPRMNGRDAFLEMQKINKDIKALLISGFSIDGEAQTLLDAGMKGFIQKPFNMKMLAKTVAETLKN